MESKTISQMFYNTVSKYADKDLYYHKVDGDWVGIKGSEIKDIVEKIIIDNVQVKNQANNTN